MASLCSQGYIWGFGISLHRDIPMPHNTSSQLIHISHPHRTFEYMSSTTDTTAFGSIEDGDLCANNRVITQSFPGSVRFTWGSRSGRQCKPAIARAKYQRVIISVLQEPDQATDIIVLDQDGNYEVRYTREGDGPSSFAITKGDEVCLIPSCEGRSRQSACFTIANCGEQRGARYKLLDGQSIAFEVKAGKASQITGGESQISPPTLFAMESTSNDRVETLVVSRNYS